MTRHYILLPATPTLYRLWEKLGGKTSMRHQGVADKAIAESVAAGRLLR